MSRRDSPAPVTPGVPAHLVAALEEVAAGPGLPHPGGGATTERLAALAGWAGTDLTLARLGEAHADALAILTDAGQARKHVGATYGVWATRSRRTPLVAERHPGGWKLVGRKEFCSGAAVLRRALVSADGPDGYRLFDVDLGHPGVSTEAGSWPAVGMSGSDSLTVAFDGVDVTDADAVGGPGSYLQRPGFWFGAVGVAACWYGGARALVDVTADTLGPQTGDVVLADLGRAVTLVRAQWAVLAGAGAEIDADPLDTAGRAAFRAQTVRQAVHDSCTEVLALAAAAGGARPLGHDGDQSRRAADLYVYLAQHHGGSDAAAIGRSSLEGDRWR